MSTRKEFLFLITDELAGLRLDKALAQHHEIESRSQATSLIDRGFVTLGDKVVKPAHKTTTGETFNVLVPLEEPIELIPYDFSLDLLYEDQSVIVVNKPSGLVVHPAVGHRQDTLVNALLHHTNELASGFSDGRPGLVHRLDKDTTGVIVIAKTDSALRALAAQFKKKTAHRVYWLVVYGRPPKMSGTITSYIRRSPIDRKKFASEKVVGHAEPEGKLAITHYEVKKINPGGLALIHCQLETGRTHQIRVHMSEMSHAIVADPVYGTSHRHKSLSSARLREAALAFLREAEFVV
jgi:23S rRNA pseudouridine1911/1915/1917 synthase